MTKIDRRKEELCEMLAVQPEWRVSDVVEKMQVSEATARRLFARLEEEGKLIRTHGGIKKIPKPSMAYSYDLSITQAGHQKRAIGKAAAAKVQSGDKLFMDSGTTILMLGEALSARLAARELRNLTVITNSLLYTESLADSCDVLLIGGKIRPQRRDVCGSSAEKNLADYHFDHAFLGADSISAPFGIMTTDELTANMNRIVIRQSKQVHVLTDSGKFGRNSFVSYARPEEVSSIMTDAELDPQQIDAFKKQDIQLEIISLP